MCLISDSDFTLIPQSQHKITIININELQIQYIKEILVNKRSEFHGTAHIRE